MNFDLNTEIEHIQKDIKDTEYWVNRYQKERGLYWEIASGLIHSSYWSQAEALDRVELMERMIKEHNSKLIKLQKQKAALEYAARHHERLDGVGVA